MKLSAPNLTWRTRKRLRTLGMILGLLALAGLVVWLCWIVWLGRFMVYSRDGVRLDFDWVAPGAFLTAEPPETQEITIVYDDGNEPVVEHSGELEQLTGCYITTEMLTGDVAELDRLIRELPKGTAVMLELKSGTGNFYYDTTLPDASVSSKVDTDAVADLIAYLAKADYYTIASVSALRDRAYGLENTSCGILHSSGRYLWAGDDKCYWLDPAKSGTRTWLVSVATELRDLGFDEVVFTDFSFPPTEDILYEGDKLTILNETAQHLVYNLATEEFCVSFLCNEDGFSLPEGRSRLYRDGVDASMAQSVAASLPVPDPQIHLVYLTEVHDTRFDTFSVLRPLPTGVTQLPPAATDADEPEEPAAEPEEPNAAPAE